MTPNRANFIWIFNNEEYTQLYHKCFSEFITSYFDSGYFAGFTDAEIEYALKNCKVDWKERAVICARGYGQGYDETIYHLTQVQGFSMEDAIYGVNNMN